MTTRPIEVRYFAKFRDLANCAAETVDTGAKTAAELFVELSHRHGIEEPIHHCKVAINDTLTEWDQFLTTGDVVLLFPPVAGG